MKRNAIAQWVLGGLGLGLLSGCNYMPANNFREEFHQTYSLSENGSVRLENVNGRVVISTWDRPEVQVDAVKTASSEERLSETKIVVKAEAGSFSIKTEQPKSVRSFWRWNNNPAAIEYVLKVPAKALLESISTVNGSVEITGARAGLRASTVNGRIKAQQISGNSHLTTVNGGVEADVVQLGKDQTCHLETVNGHARLSVPAEINAEVEASTVNGSLRNDFGIQNTSKWPNQHIKATLGTGGATIKMTTVNGGISIQRASSPKSVSLEVQ